ncbi:MAG: family 78 glycoside hydrolase catalytic domain [Clostridiales bacterium]|jgi:hypothetical protein|nr:family 78 glycoside hydrolase catalytic domain [Clostridiales bacterium]
MQRDDRVIDYVMPVAIKSVAGGVGGVQSLLKQKLPQIGLSEPDCAVIEGAGHIILDFGRELSGGVRILTHRAEGNTRVRIRFGESLSEACSDIKGRAAGATATNNHSLRDFEAELVFMSDMRFGQTGFRFVRLDFFEGCQVTVKSIYAAFEHRCLNRLGRFSCSDPVINDIFETAAYTVELCMQNMLWDGIKRDRLVWIGDTHPEMLSIVSLFGEDKCIEQALAFARNEAPLPAFMNTIPSYSLWWLVIIADYFTQNNNIGFLYAERAYIKSLVSLIDSLIDRDGNLNFPGYFLDWPTADADTEGRAGTYALCAYAIEKTKIIYGALNEDGAVLDGILGRIDRSLKGGTYKQVAAMRVLAGFDSPGEALENQLRGGAKGMSTFMSYYILSSIAMAGRTEAALGIMREYYNGMLQRGATTFWEDFDVAWLENSGRIDRLPQENEKDIHGDFGAHCYKGFRHSLCHGWASGPVPFLMHHILGIKVCEAGCRKVAIKPNLGGLSWASGAYPTPYGNIEVNVKDENGKTRVEMRVPQEIEIVP